MNVFLQIIGFFFLVVNIDVVNILGLSSHLCVRHDVTNAFGHTFLSC
jgi:hypothetical protein